MSDIWSAMSDPTRRRIIQLLRNSEMNAGEIAEHFEMTKPSVSHHLSILKNADLVKAKRTGQNVIYKVNTSVLEELLIYVASMIGKDDSDEKSTY